MVRQRRQYLQQLWMVASALLVILVFRVLAGIVYEYQWYFPANFRASGFLAGRESFFHGVYRHAFYAHIGSGPLVILLGMYLFWSRRRRFQIRVHRILGKAQFVLVVFVLAPTGLVMATRAYSGYIAGAGFAALALTTQATAILSIVCVKRGDLHLHRRWSSRLLILLLSPIVLRVSSGTMIVLGIESHTTYQLNAWSSWLIPLIGFEIWNRYPRREHEGPFGARELDRTSGQYLEKAT